MSKRNIEAIYPLSPMQQGMLFHTLYAPDSEVYMEQTIAALRGPLDAAHFEQAWHAMLQRHTILRTSFAWKKLEQMLQIVHKQVALPFHQEDWRSLSAEEQRTRLDEFVRADRQEGFKLAKPPLLRLALFRLADDVHQIVISAHHIILDGWSLPLLVKELMTAYESLAQGQGPLLPPVRPYRDYINWLQKQDQATAEAFWRQQLQGFSAPTPLVVERPQPGRQGYRETEVRLSAETTAALQQLARQHQVTLNTLFQAAYALLLHRYSGEEDILFGATVSGRPADLPGAESIIGLFINTLPVRVQFTPRMRVTDLLAQLMVQQGALRQYEYSSLVQIQEWSDVPPGAPLFNSILVFENYPVDETLRQRQGSLVIDDVYANEQTNYPLTVVSGPGREMALKVSYDRSRFADATIDRLLGHFKTILESFVADAEQPVTAVPLLTPHEITQLVHTWNDNAAPFDARLIHDWFEETAARFPDAPAVVFTAGASAAGGEGAQLTYRELDERANQLAHYLQKQGVGPESIVAICADHSPEMIVAAVGVLKAGGAYLPLDPANPPDRLAYMLEDSGAKVLLTTAEIQQTIFEPLPIVNRQSKIVNLDADWPHIAQEPTAKPASSVTPANVAYLIYTSGSTGLPKGTLLEHRGLCNYINAFVPLLDIKHGTQVLLFSSFSFDAATADIFMAILSGATLHLAARQTLMSPDALSDLLHARAISYVTLPPAMWRALPAGDYPALQTAMSAGEALTQEIVDRWAPSRRFFNGYGPTENTIGASVTPVNPAAKTHVQTAISHPPHNIRAYVLDAQQQPVPIGVPGELCLAGASLSRGYLGRPQLTAEKFIPDPFSPTPGARMYRTGDLVAFRPDGSVDFLGRIDFQVKIRGYRVELGEIEALLSEYAGLRQTAVIANSDWRTQPQIKPDGEADPANLEIVAYIVPQPDHEPGAGELREFLSARLPDYMLPARYVVVDEMPLTPNGKIDRRALLALDKQQLFSADGYVPPRTPAEELLANIWAQVLGAERVGAHDNFFELGGQSLLATRLATRLRDAFDVEVPLRHIFERPTVVELAETIQALQVGEELIAPPIEPAPRGESLPLSFAQQRLWFLDQLEPNSPYYNIATAVRLSGPLDVAALQRSVNATVARHETLRTTFTTVSSQPRPGHRRRAHA
jgi:amino acid adenylation domain-containing protein